MVGRPIPRGYSKQVEREIINARFESVVRNPELIETDPWDLSGIFYDTRKRLDAEGYDVSPLNDENTHKRKELYGYVREYCDKIIYCRYCKRVRPKGNCTCEKCKNRLYLGVKRHQIGIFPADRAILYFKGREIPINFKNYKRLAELGTDILCVEKQDTATKLESHTRAVGIALLQSRGFLIECGEWLAEEATKVGANVIILTDFDASGIDIAFQLEGVIRLGVGPDTIKWLNDHRDMNKDKVLDIDRLTESSLNKKGEAGSHWQHLNLVLGHDIPELRCNSHNTRYIKYLQKQTPNGERYIDFLYSHRIELNTIINEVKAKRFSEWVISQLLERFPNRDYNRAVELPWDIQTPTMEELNKELSASTMYILEDIFTENEEALKDIEGLMNVEDTEKGITKYCQDILKEDPLIQKIHLGVKRLEKRLRKYRLAAEKEAKP